MKVNDKTEKELFNNRILNSVLETTLLTSTTAPTTTVQNTKLIPLILLLANNKNKTKNNRKSLNPSSIISDYYFNNEEGEEEDDYDESTISSADDYVNHVKSPFEETTSNKQPLWINTDTSVPAILRSIFKMRSYYDRPVRICYTKTWPSCVKFLLDSSKADHEIRLNSNAYKFTKFTPAIIANNPEMSEFDITKLENSINGFYLSTYIKLLVNKDILISKTKMHVLTTPNIIITWQSIINTTEDGHLDIIIKFSDSYYYKSLLIPFKLNKYYFIEINFDPLNATLDVYKNMVLYSTTNIHSFYDPELFTFSESLFEIGPIIDERHTVVLDSFKLYNTAKSYFKMFKKSLKSKNLIPAEQQQIINLRGDLKTVLKLNSFVVENNRTSDDYEYEYNDNNNNSDVEDSFYFDEFKFNDTIDSQGTKSLSIPLSLCLYKIIVV